MDTFLPFIAEYQYVFRADNVRAAYARLPEAQRALVPWYPERLDWRQWFLEVHVPALERYVFPLMERRSGRRA
jgi:long-chain acyl-CoA synthetase